MTGQMPFVQMYGNYSLQENTVKVPDGGHTERMFTCSDVCTSDGLTCMSK